MNHEIRLPALLGSHPLGALASFGLLRKLSEWDGEAKLAFSMEDDWVATVRTRVLSDTDALIERLCDWLASDLFDRLLGWSNDVRMEPAEFQKQLSAAIKDGDLLLAGLLSAVAAVGAVDAQKGFIKPSAFYMVSGQQSFLGGMREIVSQARADAHAAFEEALVGPWRYRMRAHSLGWDPSTERLHALRHRAPTSEKPVCIGGAVILAFWSLSLFPAVAENGRAATTGFERDGGEQYFNWPIWSVPIGLDELTSLLHAGKTAWISRHTGELRPGIETVYRSRRAEFGQGYAILRAPEVLLSSNSWR